MFSTKQESTRVGVEAASGIDAGAFQLNKKAHVLRVKNVVESASTVETPQILLYSGIQGTAIGNYLSGHTGCFSNPTITIYKPAIGRYLTGHVSILTFVSL